jgi:hypothetical protein
LSFYVRINYSDVNIIKTAFLTCLSQCLIYEFDSREEFV